MKSSYCYLPILKARSGHFNAVRTVSPTARSRFAPLFDLLPPMGNQAAKPRAYLEKKVKGIVSCWAPERPVYIDAHDYAVDTLIDRRTPVELVTEGIRAHGFRPVPVTGCESERGADYVRITGQLAAKVGTGICLRVERDDIVDARTLADTLSRSLTLLPIPIQEVDLLLDLGFVGKDSPMELNALIREALYAVAQLGEFRNVVVAGGSMPEQLPKRDTGIVRREARIEMQAWSDVHALEGFATPIAFGDFGVLNPGYVKPGRPVNVPARVRYTTSREHLLLRTARTGHADLCRQLRAMEDYAGAAYSAGDQRMDLAARGLANPGHPGIWVAGDLNHHLEFVSAQVWQLVRAQGLASRYSLPEPRRYPWLQPVLVEE